MDIEHSFGESSCSVIYPVSHTTLYQTVSRTILSGCERSKSQVGRGAQVSSAFKESMDQNNVHRVRNIDDKAFPLLGLSQASHRPI